MPDQPPSPLGQSQSPSKQAPSPSGQPPAVTLADFQRLIGQRYGPTDAARGTPGTFMWMIEEVGELATSLHECSPDQNPTPEQLHNLEEEFADVLAWLTTLANINNIDLTKAVSKYTDPSRVEGFKA